MFVRRQKTTGNHSIGKDAVILTIAKIITTAIGLVSSMLLARYCSLEEYGTYSQILLVINLATAFFTLGLPNSTNYFLGRSSSHEERKNFLSVYYTLNTILCFVMGIVLALSTPIIIGYFDNEGIKSFTYILALLPWTIVITGSISNVLVVYGQTKKLTLFNITSAMVIVVAIVVVKIFDWTFKWYMFLYLIGECIMMAWGYVIVFKLESTIKPLFDLKIIKEILKFSIPIGLASLVGTLTLECDKLVIGKIFDTETLAIYTNAAKELPFTIIATSLTAVLLPQMAKKLKENKNVEAIDLWRDTVELSYIFMAFVVTALIVFAPQIMTILYSEKYLPGVNIFRIYSAVLLLRITYFGMVLNASGKTKFILYSSILTLIVNVVLDIGLYYIIGIIGPAIATFVSIFIASIAQLWVTSKTVQIKFGQIFPWRKIALNSFINMVWGVLAAFMLSILGVGTSTREIMYCIIAGVFITMLYALLERKNILRLWKKLNVVS